MVLQPGTRLGPYEIVELSAAVQAGGEDHLAAPAPSHLYAPRRRIRGWKLFCYVLDAGRFVIGGAINNGGLVLRWLRDVFGDPDASEADIVRIASDVPAG